MNHGNFSNLYTYIFDGLAALSILSYVLIFLRISTNTKFFNGDSFIIYAIMSFTYLMQNFSFLLILISTELCEIQAFLLVLSDSCQLVWNVILILQTYHFITFQTVISKLKWIWFFFIGFVLPLCFTLIGYYLKILERTFEDGWCWISKSEQNISASVYAWIILSLHTLLFFFNLFILYFSKKIYIEIVTELELKLKLKKYYKIFRIAWINNFTMIFAIVNRYMLIFKIECDWLVHLVLIIYSGSGILHLIVFNCNYRNMTYINNMEALV